MSNRLLYLSLFIGCFAFICHSCSKKNISVVELPASKQLVSKLSSINVDVVMPSKIFINNNKLIIFEPLPEKMFKVFDLHSLKHLYSFGDRGRGPHEFISIGNEEIVDTKGKYVELYDVGRLVSVEFSDSSAQIVGKKTLPTAHLNSPANRVRKISDTEYYFDNIPDEKNNAEFVLLNTDNSNFSYFGQYPNWIKNLENTKKFFAYVKSSVYNKNKNRLIVFYSQYQAIKVLLPDGTTIKEIHLEEKINHVSEMDGTVYFAEPFATDNYVYVLWIKQSKNDIGMNISEFRPELLVFDWDGNILDRFKLDQPVLTYTVSENLNKIYATSFTETNIIYEYELPGIGVDTLKLSNVDNMFYSFDILEGYQFAQNSIESGINNVVTRNVVKENTNYFSQKRSENGSKRYDLESIKVNVYTPENKWDESKRNEILHASNSNRKNTQHYNINLNDLHVLKTIYSSDFIDPKGKPDVLYGCQYIFEKSGRIVEITIYSSQNNFHLYDNAMRRSIKSFFFKDDIG